MPTAKKPTMPREGTTGGSSTVPLTPERKEFLKELERRNKAGRDAGSAQAKLSPDYKRAKGGKISDKAGRALVKKSADTMGRAMTKKACGGKMKGYAKGGSVAARADGVAKKGHTRGKVL